MAEYNSIPSPSSVDPLVGQLGRAFAAVDVLVSKVRPEQWFASTPCTEWSVRQLVDHLIGMNLMVTALLEDAPPPRRSAVERADADRVTASRDSASSLLLAFSRPGVLEREYRGPLGRRVVPIGCRSGSTTCLRTAGILHEPRGNPSTCPTISPSSPFPSPANS
jgi:hypothetical protein